MLTNFLLTLKSQGPGSSKAFILLLSSSADWGMMLMMPEAVG